MDIAHRLKQINSHRAGISPTSSISIPPYAFGKDDIKITQGKKEDHLKKKKEPKRKPLRLFSHISL